MWLRSDLLKNVQRGKKNVNEIEIMKCEMKCYKTHSLNRSEENDWERALALAFTYVLHVSFVMPVLSH